MKDDPQLVQWQNTSRRKTTLNIRGCNLYAVYTIRATSNSSHEASKTDISLATCLIGSQILVLKGLNTVRYRGWVVPQVFEGSAYAIIILLRKSSIASTQYGFDNRRIEVVPFSKLQ